MIRRLSLHLPGLWASAAVVLVSGREIAALTVVITFMLAIVVGPRLRVSRGVETMLCSALGLVAAALAWLLDVRMSLVGLKPPPNHHVAIMLAGVMIAAFRAHIQQPAGGDRATVAFSLAAAIGIGAMRTPLYPAFLAGLLIALLSALRRADRGRGPLLSMGAREATLSAVIAAVGVAFTLAFARILPPIHDRVQDYAIETFGLDSAFRRSGFSRSLELGSLREIIRSDAKVFRVYGAEVDHLRGAVYDRYAFGRWLVPLDERPKRIVLPASPPSEPYTEVVSIGDENAHLFAPLEAHAIGAPSGRAAVDPMGLLAPVEDDPADRIWFVPTPGDRPSIRPPRETDLDVPDSLRRALRPIAFEWTSGASTPRSRLEAIQRRFARDFEYALEFDRDERKDPILEFLVDRKTGHCEYFASAMALLARTSTIPARVAGGFLVTERSTAGDYWIVRQSNAHAWVEAWIDGKWVTFDPTPPSGIATHMRRTATAADALTDRLSELGGRAMNWLRARTVGQLLVALAMGLAFVFRKELASLVRRTPSVAAGAYAEPPPELRRMLAILDRRGHGPTRGESLEHLAARQPDEVAILLRRYAAARYGSKEPLETVRSALDRWCESVG